MSPTEKQKPGRGFSDPTHTAAGAATERQSAYETGRSAEDPVALHADGDAESTHQEDAGGEAVEAEDAAFAPLDAQVIEALSLVADGGHDYGAAIPVPDDEGLPSDPASGDRVHGR